MAWLILLLLVIGGTACIPPTPAAPPPQAIPIELGDSLTRRLLDWQNERATDRLLPYLSHEDTRYRLLATRAFGSFANVADHVADSLASRLRNDAAPAVREQAAYALGQLGSRRHLGALTAAFDTTDRHRALNGAILQAVGKLGELKDAEQLASVTSYTPADTLLQEARAYGLFYGALRGVRSPVTDGAITEQLLDPAQADRVRHVAAQYLQRIEVAIDTQQQQRLLELLRTNDDPLLLMGVAHTLSRSEQVNARVALLRLLDQHPDWRVRVEAIRSLSAFDYPTVRESVIDALRDTHPLVARAAATYLLEHGTGADAPLYFQLAESPLPHGLSTQLYRAANRHLSPFLTDYRQRITDALQLAYAQTEEVYKRAEVVQALAEFPWMYRSLYGYYSEATHPVVRTAAAEAIVGIAQRDDFDAFFRASSRRVRRELNGYLRSFIESAEEGPAYHAAEALKAAPARYRDQYPDLDWLDRTLSGMDLPRQLETYQAIAAARAALLGESIPAAAPLEALPIDWSTVGDSTAQRYTITTLLGDITLLLWPTVAPATVSSFARLVARNYYDGKVFHRVVPNFVAQGGGPRGDGFGSENFVLRTETPPVHWDRAGLIGMASAGRDTEGVQFFLTHRPTPHLDGKYTIFGEVTAGQDVVDRLTPGTPILRITATPAP